MVYLELFTGFLIVGLFSFGGAYGAIPLIRDVVLSYGWLDEETLTDMIAVSESTPGPIIVNLATYVGSSQAGIPGAVLATFIVILPAFLIIILILAVLNKLWENKYAQAVIRGLKPCIIGIILETGCIMIIKNGILPVFQGGKDIRPLFFTVILLAVYFIPRRLIKKKMSPVMLIVFSAVLGITVYGLKISG